MVYDFEKKECPPLRFTGDIHVVTKDTVVEACEKIRSLPGEAVVGFDMEWPIYTRDDTTALIQIAPSPDECYIFHLPSLGGLPAELKRIIVGTRIKKVGSYISNDINKLERDFGVPAAHIMRNSAQNLEPLANRMTNVNRTWSLDALTRRFLHHRLADKDRTKGSVRVSDWSDWPLSQQQLEYAAVDAVASLLVYQAIVNWK